MDLKYSSDNLNVVDFLFSWGDRFMRSEDVHYFVITTTGTTFTEALTSLPPASRRMCTGLGLSTLTRRNTAAEAL